MRDSRKCLYAYGNDPLFPLEGVRKGIGEDRELKEEGHGWHEWPEVGADTPFLRSMGERVGGGAEVWWWEGDGVSFLS